MRPAAAAALLLALLAASGALAQTAVKAKRRPQAPPPAVSRAPPAASRSAVPVLGLGAGGGGLAQGGLAQAGLRAPGDGGSVCRAACARNRYACEVADESCAPQWSACVKSCIDSGPYGSSSLLPRE